MAFPDSMHIVSDVRETSYLSALQFYRCLPFLHRIQQSYQREGYLQDKDSSISSRMGVISTLRTASEL